jgi:hypothetical protein
VSVLILSGAIIYVLKVHSQNREQIIYVSERNLHALEDSLFLSENAFRYHQSDKSAYDLLQNDLQPENTRSRHLLKNIKRRIYLPEPINLLPEDEAQGPAAVIREVKLNGTYPASFYRFNLQSL